MQVYKLQVTGMTCSACSTSLEKSLLGLEGVQSASVSLALQQAEVAVASKMTEEVGAHGSLAMLGSVMLDLCHMTLPNPTLSRPNACVRSPQACLRS